MNTTVPRNARPSATSRPLSLYLPALLLGMALALGTAGARAQQACELNGAWVNPNNGSTTAGKSGLMRCRDREGGQVAREQELRDGRFIGIVRYYRDGVLEREYSVNANGNREGVAKAFSVKPGGSVLREETLRDGTTVGGRVNRERERDENGTVTRDDALFEDGSRRAFAP